MAMVGLIIFVVSFLSLLVALVWVVVAAVSGNTHSRNKAARILGFSALGMLAGFTMCSVGM
jgi:hypothetical protein